MDESLGQNGEQETTSLAGTSLSTSHEITAAHDDGDGVLLNRGGHSVAGKPDVADEVVVQRRVGEVQDGLRNILARSLDRDIVVLLEVDAAVLLGRIIGGAEEVPLHTRIGRAGNVLAVAPLTVARPASITAATTAGGITAGTWVAISVRVEAAAAASSRTTAPVLSRSAASRRASRSAARRREITLSVPASGRRSTTSIEGVVSVIIHVSDMRSTRTFIEDATNPAQALLFRPAGGAFMGGPAGAPLGGPILPRM
jgi:hypothetical protein